MRKTILLAALSVLLCGLPAVQADAQTADVGKEIEQVEKNLQDAQATYIHLISPNNFREATEKLTEAKQLAERGGKINEIRRRLRESQEALDSAKALQQVGSLLLEDALIAWPDALAANAPEYAPDEWKAAKSAMDKAGREIEKGDHSGARDKAAKATEAIRIAEFEAIRTDLLGKAKELRAEALVLRADERASITLGNSESLLRQAEQVLQSDRYQRGEASTLALQAADQYRHAANIARIQAQVERNSKAEVERLVLRHEQLLSRIAEGFGAEITLADGLEPATERLVAAATSVARDRANIQEELAAKNEEVVFARNRADSLDARLAQLEKREQLVTAELRVRQDRSQKTREIRQLFTPSEATCVETADGFVIRLGGIAFPVGSSEIQPRDFPVLTKVQQALRQFPDTPVVIEGHTDGQGDEDFNQALSERRAEAVSTYLIANMGGIGSRFSSVGFGESSPIASNETQEGRAENRRIDIRIKLSDMSPVLKVAEKE